MAQEESAGVLGVSVVDDQLRVVEGRKHLNEFQVLEMAHGRVRHRFDFESLEDKNIARRFAEDLNRLCESHHFQVRDAAFSLDSRMVLIKKLPVDTDLDEATLDKQIAWEVSQFTISPLHEYIVDFERLNSVPEKGDVQYVLVVTVRKRIVEYVRQIFKHTDLKLRVVDVDIFSAQRALQLNYNCKENGRIGLVDIGMSKVNVAILQGRNYYYSQEFPLPSNGTGGEETSEATAHLISKELRRIIVDQELGRSVEDLDEIYLYGEGVEDRVLEGLQNAYNVRIDRANPFRKVRLASRLKEEYATARPERFMIAVGAAIRGVQ